MVNLGSTRQPKASRATSTWKSAWSREGVTATTWRAARPFGHLAAEPASAGVHGDVPVLFVLRDRGRPVREEDLGAALSTWGVVGHLHKAADLLYKHENMECRPAVAHPDGEFPELLDFHPTKDYVREVLDEQAPPRRKRSSSNWTSCPATTASSGWNDQVNGRIQNVPSHRVIREEGAEEGWRGRLPHRGMHQPSPVRAAQPQGGQHEARPRAGL